MNNNKCESIGGRPSVGISDRLARTFVYIDGFNLYHAVNKFQNKSYKWCNLRNLFNLFTDPNIETIDEIKFFTSPPKHIKTPSDTKLKNHENYCNVLEQHCNIRVISGNFAKRDVTCKHCNTVGLFCQICNNDKRYKHEEKQTDVNLALNVILDCVYQKPDNIIICSADTDFIPVIRGVRKYNLCKKIKFFIPPNNNVSNDLRIDLGKYYNTHKIKQDEKVGIVKLEETHFNIDTVKLPNSITLQDGTTITNPYI
jgi:uncharacterized LabA/DUF88 family protein